jgi:DNA N-6-adenine-methyltransferase Dam
MSAWEAIGQSDEWRTPKFIFDAMAIEFDLDPCSPPTGFHHVPYKRCFYAPNGLIKSWTGTVWMNPPFGGRNSIKPWLDKFFDHGDGVALTPDRTSAPWWQEAACKADAVLFVAPKIKFIRPDGTLGKSPGCGTSLMASGWKGYDALKNAERNGLGLLFSRI